MSVNTYIPFSEQDKLRASEVDLVLFLQCRGERLERSGNNHKLIYTDGSGTHDSITVSGNKWFDHKNKCGGGPIKFLREHYGMSYQDAMLELLGGNYFPTEQPKRDTPQKEVKKEFELPEANGNMRRVFAYLTKQRHIDTDVISFFAHEHKLYEDLKALYGIEPAPAIPHIRREKYLSFADDLKFSPVQINRISCSLSAEKNYLSAADISLSASAILISRTQNASAEEMFDKLKSGLKNQYKSYADKGKLSSKSSELEKLKKTVAFKLRRNAFSESEIKDISKTLFECADCALKCHTEQLLMEGNTEELSEENSLALKM